MTNDVNDIIKALDLIHTCCETISDCGGCGECPLGTDCFEYNSMLDGLNISAGKWKKFIGFADDVEEYMDELNMTEEEKHELEMLDEYDRRRKGERDERAFEEW